MNRFCPACGTYTRDKPVNPAIPATICPECEHAEPFRQLPLFVIGGASGVGKSTAYRTLLRTIDDVVLLDVDAMWEPAFGEIQDAFDYNVYYLRQCRNITQSGRPVALFGAETGMPGVVEASGQRRYFTNVYYLALVCDESLQTDRLRDRPNWEADDDKWTEIDEQVALNRWYKDRGKDPDSPIKSLDVTASTPQSMATDIRDWIREHVDSAEFNTPEQPD